VENISTIEHKQSKVTKVFDMSQLYVTIMNPIVILECSNRTIQNMMLAICLNLKKCLWAESCSPAVYLQNSLPHSFINGMTPYKALYHVKLKISHLRTFGASCYTHIASEKCPPSSKLHSREELATFVRYKFTSHVYRIQESNKHIHSILANECYFPKNASPTAPNSLQLSHTPTNLGTESRFAEIEMGDPVIITNSNEPNNFEISVPLPPEDAQQYLPIELSMISKPAIQQVSNGTHHKPRPFWETIDLPDPSHTKIFACTLLTTEEYKPRTHNEAISCLDAPKWFQAMQEELDLLKDQNVWTIVFELKNGNIVGCRWVYKIK